MLKIKLRLLGEVGFDFYDPRVFSSPFLKCRKIVAGFFKRSLELSTLFSYPDVFLVKGTKK